MHISGSWEPALRDSYSILLRQKKRRKKICQIFRQIFFGLHRNVLGGWKLQIFCNFVKSQKFQDFPEFLEFQEILEFYIFQKSINFVNIYL